MGFEIYVVWYEKGDKATVPLAEVEALFRPAIEAREARSWRLRYGDQECVADLQLEADRVVCLSVERPCAAAELWHSLCEAMKLSNGVCFWPGGPVAVTADSVVGELPEDMLEDGEPVVVRDGAELRAAVAEQ